MLAVTKSPIKNSQNLNPNVPNISVGALSQAFLLSQQKPAMEAGRPAGGWSGTEGSGEERLVSYSAAWLFVNAAAGFPSSLHDWDGEAR